MSEVIVKIDKKEKIIIPNLVFASKNPKTNQYNVNLCYSENDTKECIQIFCQEEETEALVLDIRNERITDLRSYIAQKN